MFPLGLRLRNFLSYGLEGGELDLKPIHLACLSGANGNGKSALIDAITWALWGKSRAAREDDLVRQGTTDMEVELEFAANHAVYRVIRKRTLRKSASLAALELAVRDGDSYKAITGDTIADTERAIAGIVKLSYETFVNSSLLLQGRADTFTVKRPAERKEILGEILGLGQYETLAESAREKERMHRAAADNHRSRMQELDIFLAGLPALREECEMAAQQLTATQLDRARHEEHAANLERAVNALSGIQESLARLDQRLVSLTGEESNSRLALDAANARMAHARELLELEALLREQAVQLQAARHENDRLSALLLRVRDLERGLAEARQAIATEEASIRAAIGATRRELEGIAAAQQVLQGIESELLGARASGATAPDAQAERDSAAAALNTIAAELGGLRASIESLDTRRKELRDRIKRLQSAGAICPTCGSTLDESRRDQAHREAMSEGIACKERMVAEQQLQASVTLKQQEAEQRLKVAEAALRAAHEAGRREAELEAKARMLREQAGRRDAVAEALRLDETTLQAGHFAEAARARLRETERLLGALGYNAQEHQAVADRIRSLMPVEQKLTALDGARQELQTAAVDAATSTTRLQAIAEERVRITADRLPLEAQLAGMPAARAALREGQEALRQARAAEAALQQKLGNLRARIEDANQREALREAAASAMLEAERLAWANRELAIIFGKRGIQAMLIENALPELEQDTNELLARMTDNSTQVTFATQRTGTGGRTIETLEIKIADTMGTRNYEMFSGGEAFRINFAIRIALSKLLVRRAGTDLSFLVIDEGFGTQDMQGRDRIVEAISSIKDEFEKILVVTHIDELKEQFDVHVEVSKAAAGSRISISAA